MDKKIRISIGEDVFRAVLNNSRLAGLIWETLPVTVPFQMWGEEIYFPIPVREEGMENPVETVNAGDLGYWPEGSCFCIFYGLTPISSPGKIKPASAVEVIGQVEDPEAFKQVQRPGKVTIERE
ncbi:MAG: hypothetical protein HY892_19510 [Deltaproteobacteria bacterium]|nr:hypothetical protein [Deltaproteobacteria bacterium]